MLYRFAEISVKHVLFLCAPPETKPGNGLCKTGNIALFGNVVYSGLLNDHFWHFGVPLVTRLVSNYLLCAFLVDPHPCHIHLQLWLGFCRILGRVQAEHMMGFQNPGKFYISTSLWMFILPTKLCKQDLRILWWQYEQIESHNSTKAVVLLLALQA